MRDFEQSFFLPLLNCFKDWFRNSTLLHLSQNITFSWSGSIASFKIKMKVNISSQFKCLVVFFNVIFKHICNDYLVLPPLFSYSKEAHMVRYLKITL